MPVIQIGRPLQACGPDAPVFRRLTSLIAESTTRRAAGVRRGQVQPWRGRSPGDAATAVGSTPARRHTVPFEFRGGGCPSSGSTEHDGPVGYRERATSVPGVVLWERTVDPGSELTLILPDGCMDLIWDGCRLFVAGPDSTARWHKSRPGTRLAGLRFSGGTGPAFVGVRAAELLDLAPDLDELWPTRRARDLSHRAGADPVAALEGWMITRCPAAEIDPLGLHILGMTKSGLGASDVAERLDLSARQLHRRCLSLFGYGPQRLRRIVRMGRALDEARAGASLAEVAAGCGYVDQAHLCRDVRDLAGTTPARLLRHLRRREERE